MSLKEKEWDGICPVPKCNCFHQDEYNWIKSEDIKQFLKDLQDFIDDKTYIKETGKIIRFMPFE